MDGRPRNRRHAGPGPPAEAKSEGGTPRVRTGPATPGWIPGGTGFPACASGSKHLVANAFEEFPRLDDVLLLLLARDLALDGQRAGVADVL